MTIETHADVVLLFQLRMVTFYSPSRISRQYGYSQGIPSKTCTSTIVVYTEDWLERLMGKWVNYRTFEVLDCDKTDPI